MDLSRFFFFPQKMNYLAPCKSDILNDTTVNWKN